MGCVTFGSFAFCVSPNLFVDCFPKGRLLPNRGLLPTGPWEQVTEGVSGLTYDRGANRLKFKTAGNLLPIILEESMEYTPFNEGKPEDVNM